MGDDLHFMHNTNTTKYFLKKQLKDHWDRVKASPRIQLTDMSASIKNPESSQINNNVYFKVSEKEEHAKFQRNRLQK